MFSAVIEWDFDACLDWTGLVKKEMTDVLPDILFVAIIAMTNPSEGKICPTFNYYS